MNGIVNCIGGVIGVSLLLISPWATAGEWGNLNGRFVYDGKPPVMKQLDTKGKGGFAAGLVLFDESLVVGKDGGIKDVVVWVRNKDIPIDKALEKKIPDYVTIDIVGGRFEPHMAKMLTGQKLRFINKDPTAYNTNATFIVNEIFQHQIAAGPIDDWGQIWKAEYFPVQIVDNTNPNK